MISEKSRDRATLTNYEENRIRLKYFKYWIIIQNWKYFTLTSESQTIRHI